VDFILQALVPLGEGAVSDSITHNVDIRAKLQMSKALGFIKKPSAKWFGDLEKCLNIIDNDLRTKRNRMVHDSWIVSSDAVIKMQKVAQIIKPQSRQTELQTRKETPVTSEEIQTVINDLNAQAFELLHLLVAFIGHEDPAKLEESDTEFQQFVLARI